jgi:hypothetical protein
MKNFVLLRSTCPFAAGVDFQTEILGINAVMVGWRLYWRWTFLSMP